MLQQDHLNLSTTIDPKIWDVIEEDQRILVNKIREKYMSDVSYQQKLDEFCNQHFDHEYIYGQKFTGLASLTGCLETLLDDNTTKDKDMKTLKTMLEL